MGSRIHGFVAPAVVVSMALSTALAAGPEVQPVKADKSHTEPKTIILANDLVSYSFDKTSGALLSMHHKLVNRTLAIGDSAVAPIRVWLGTEREPDQSEVRISKDAQVLSSYRILQGDEGLQAEFTWDDAKDTQGQSTGLVIRLSCRLDKGDEFLRLHTYIANRGDLEVTGLFLGLEGVKLTDNSAEETLSIPKMMGYQRQNPRKEFLGKSNYNVIPPTVSWKGARGSGGMFCSWYDLSAGDYGFATGYLNRRSMDMVGEARFDDTGGAFGWRLFRLQGAWRFMHAVKGEAMVYPLRMGEDFRTDEWFMGLHRGDWHTTAKYYRKAYEREFAGDFLPWDKVSPAAKQADLVINSTAAWGVLAEDKKKHDLSRGEVRAKFLDIPKKVKTLIDDLQVDPTNCLLVMLGQATHWGIYKLPDYFPVNEEAGGTQAFREMIRQLREDMGLAGTHFYAHAAFNHPEADNYVAEADTGWSANLFYNFDHLGRIACMDSQGWWELWRDKIIPEFVAAGASGIEFDEGFGHHFICDHPKHLHSLSAESVLTAQPRGQQRIFKECRKAFGENGYLECEGGSDVGGRHFDLWEYGGTGGKNRPIEIVRFTHPDKLVVSFPGKTAEDPIRAFVYGMIVIHHVQNEVTPGLRRYIQLKREVRQAKAPGYPHCFSDNIGIRSFPDGLIAKTYADKRGITVTYYAQKQVAGDLVVDGSPLGHPQLGIQKHSINLKPLEAGYVVLTGTKPG